MHALSWSCGNGIPASGQAGGSATKHRPTVPRCYSRTGRARCARGSRSRPATHHPGVRNEDVDASRSIDANASPAMVGTDVPEETRCRVVSNRTRPNPEMLEVKPVVL